MAPAITLFPILPEVFIACAAGLILIADLYIPETRRITVFYGALSALVVGGLIAAFGASAERGVFLHQMLVKDLLGDVVKAAVCFSSAAVLVYSRRYLEARGMLKGEYLVLALFAVLGMMVMASANHFLLLYLGLELMSLCLYAMVAFQRDSELGTEAAMKYFVLGALASGMLLYGMSILYGLTGSLDISVVRGAVAELSLNNMALIFAVVFVVVSLAFKLGVVPFHMWVPDVYHGAPTASTLFVATAPKIASFAIIMRLLVDGLGDLHSVWRDMVIILAVLSMGAGNLIAIAQTNFKRLLAYSAISHMGYLLLGIVAGTSAGYSAALFYSLSYALMTMGGFGMIAFLSRAGNESDELDDLRGMNERHPWLAFLLLLLMISMAGIPPTLGFFAKLWVIQAIVDQGLVWLAVLAVLFAVVGAFYYLRVLKLMYFDEPSVRTETDSEPGAQVLLGLNACALVLILPWIGVVRDLCQAAVASMTGTGSP